LLSKSLFQLENQSFLEPAFEQQTQLDSIRFDRDPQQLPSPEMLAGERPYTFFRQRQQTDQRCSLMHLEHHTPDGCHDLVKN
jgi:hypothetical protein